MVLFLPHCFSPIINDLSFTGTYKRKTSSVLVYTDSSFVVDFWFTDAGGTLGGREPEVRALGVTIWTSYNTRWTGTTSAPPESYSTSHSRVGQFPEVEKGSLPRPQDR